VAFAGDQDNIAGLRFRDGQLDGPAAVEFQVLAEVRHERA